MNTQKIASEITDEITQGITQWVINGTVFVIGTYRGQPTLFVDGNPRQMHRTAQVTAQMIVRIAYPIYEEESEDEQRRRDA